MASLERLISRAEIKVRILLLLRESRAREVKIVESKPSSSSARTITSFIIFLSVVLLNNPESLEIGLHAAEIEAAFRPDPVINQLGDRLESGSVSATVPSPKPTAYKHIAVDELVEKSRDEKASAVLCIVQNR